MTTTKTKTKKTSRSIPAKKGWTEEKYREELNHFRRSIRTVFTFTDRMKRNKIRHPETLKELVNDVAVYANNVIEMFPAGHAANPRLALLEKKRLQIENQIALAKKTA